MSERASAGDSRREPALGRNRWLPLLVYTALGAVLLAGAFAGWSRIGGKDWNYFLGQTQAEITTLQRYGQFPLWMPWRTGGQPVLAQPETMLLSPVTPLALAFGTLSAFKLLLLPLFVTGCLGMHALARRLRLTGAAAWAPALVFFGSSVFPLYVSGGWPNWLFGLALLPWLLWSLRRAEDDLRWLALAALLDAGLIYCGSIYQFIFVPVFLAVEAGVRALLERRLRPLLLLGAALGAGLLLAAPRVLPLFEIFGLYPRQVPGDEEALPLSLLARVWLGSDVPTLTSPRAGMVVAADGAAYWPYVGAFIGPLALALAALGATAWRAAAGWLVAGALFLWMALGSGVRPALWPALHDLPVFGSMHAPQRLVLVTSFGLALLAGLGLQRLQDGLARALTSRQAGLVAGLLLVAIVIHQVVVNAPLSRTAFLIEPTPDLVFADAFRQEDVPARPEQAGGEGYEAVLRNVGSVNGISDIPSPRLARPHDAPGYRGEVYLLAGHGTVEAQLTPNVITVQARLEADDVLVVNQTWFPGWVATEGEADAGSGAEAAQPLVERDSLLALPLSAGEHALTLRYRPVAVTRGLLYGALAVLVAALWLLSRRRAPVPRLGRPEVVALAGCLLIGVGVWQERPRLPTSRSPKLAVRLPALAEALHVGPGDAVAESADKSAANPTRFADLQSALDAAQPGALILVEPGRYAGFTVRRAVTLCAQPGGAVQITSPVRVERLPPGEQVLLMGDADEPLLLEQPLSVSECQGSVALQHVRAAAIAGDRLGWLALIDSSVAAPATSSASDGLEARTLRMPPAVGQGPSLALTLSPLPARLVVLSLSGAPGARGAVLLGIRPARHAPRAGQPSIDVDLTRLFVTLPVQLSESGHLELRLRAPLRLMQPGSGLFAQFATAALVEGRWRVSVAPADGRYFEFVADAR